MQTILVVDDEPIVREVVERYLRQDGFLVEVAADGREALQRFAAADLPHVFERFYRGDKARSATRPAPAAVPASASPSPAASSRPTAAASGSPNPRRRLRLLLHPPQGGLAPPPASPGQPPRPAVIASGSGSGGPPA